MIVKLESLVALGRAHAGICEQLAWLALESFERTQRMNLDAFESFWARRPVEAEDAAEIDAPAIPSDVAAAALREHWTRAHDTAVCLSQEFGRLADEYADDLMAGCAAPDAAVPEAPVRSRRPRTPRIATAMVNNA